VILEFFEIECSYCSSEIGMLKTVHDTFGSSLVTISMSITDQDTNDKLIQYRDSNSIPWIVSGAVPGVWYGLYTASSVPALFIIDQNGYVRYQNDYTASTSDITEEVQGLLGSTLTVDTPKTVIGEGFPLPINLNVLNLGDSTETFNVTAYANTTPVSTQLLTLVSGNSDAATIVWNTAGFAYGNYTLSACASPVPGETNTANNNCTGGWVIVSIPGDVTGPNGYPDGKVDMRDLGAIAKLFGTAIGNPQYNPNYDINGDGIINMKDLAIAARNFGQEITL
jgi:hypothetical protein